MSKKTGGCSDDTIGALRVQVESAAEVHDLDAADVRDNRRVEQPTRASDAPDHAPIACVDLNGVLDAYTGWRGADHFDPPRPGSREFLTALRERGFRVVIFTTRFGDDVKAWLDRYALADVVDEVTDRKPAAHVFVDDRAICFRGDFDATLREIDAFAAHWEQPREATS